MFFTEIKRKKGLPFIPSKVTHEEYEPNKKLVNIIEESKN
jgi:hypothetical protein